MFLQQNADALTHRRINGYGSVYYSASALVLAVAALTHDVRPPAYSSATALRQCCDSKTHNIDHIKR